MYPKSSLVKLDRRKLLHWGVGAFAFVAAPRVASAQAFPARPVKIVVPFAPGGIGDILMRLYSAGERAVTCRGPVAITRVAASAVTIAMK